MLLTFYIKTSYHMFMEYNHITHLGEQIICSALDLTDDIDVKALAHVYQFRFSEKYTFPGESHDMYEFYYVIEGNMKTTLDDSTFLLSAGDFIIVPPFVKHAMIPNKTYTHAISFGFIATGINSDLICYKIGKIHENASSRINTILKLYYENVNEDLSSKYFIPSKKEKLFGYKQLLKNELESLLIEISQTFKAKNLNDNKLVSAKDLTIAEMVKNHIDNHITEKIQLYEIADSFHYSTSHICRAFKSKYKESIISYTLRNKIIEAAKLIEHGEKSFQEISDDLGFDSVQYFSTVFKKYAHITPKEFKKTVLQSHIYNSASSITQIDFG